jgi:hypothetical protein
MRAVIVYESMYGNTRRIAESIADGLGTTMSVSVIGVSEADPRTLADADLVVVGGPTHLHGMSRASTRKSAVNAAKSPAHLLDVEPGAMGAGLRDWFGSLGDYSVKAAAFDTRLDGPAALTGRASKGVAHQLREHGFDLIAEPASFIVTRRDELEPDERARARDWGVTLAARVPASPSSAAG